MSKKTVFLQIINHFIHPDAQAPDLSELTAEDLTELLKQGAVHSLYPVLFDGLYRAPAFAALPEQVQQSCRSRARQQIIGQTMRTMNFLRLYELICSRGIRPLVVKGVILRNLYPNPDARASSDEDLLVRREEFADLDQLLREQGFQRDDLENPLEAHEITYRNEKNGLHL